VIPTENAQVAVLDLDLAPVGVVPALVDTALTNVGDIIGVTGAAAVDLLNATKYSRTLRQQHISLLNEFYLMEQPS